MTKNSNKLDYICYKTTHPCTDCGYYFAYQYMTFDHIRGVKQFDIPDMIRSNSFYGRKVQTELAKCDLVCIWCHLVREGRRGRTRAVNSLRGVIDMLMRRDRIPTKRVSKCPTFVYQKQPQEYCRSV